MLQYLNWHIFKGSIYLHWHWYAQFLSMLQLEHLEVVFSSECSGMCSGIYILTKMEEWCCRCWFSQKRLIPTKGDYHPEVGSRTKQSSTVNTLWFRLSGKSNLHSKNNNCHNTHLAYKKQVAFSGTHKLYPSLLHYISPRCKLKSRTNVIQSTQVRGSNLIWVHIS